MSEKITRPLCLEMRDAKEDIIRSVNNAMQQRGLPCFILRGILEEILYSVKDVERNEITTAENEYRNALREFDQKDKDNEAE